ncbi:MAG TPA: GNAT family N-acetyltransferase [Chitinophagaceae bacterium]|nr:GNAT family N-acetyltransferase [Chitinophagaceae bacterium]
MDSAIKYCRRNEIDIAKWDHCIDTASNGLIYGYSFYLDTMARHWDGLVLNDYEAVMPLTWNRKLGVSYLYQPFATAQLGLFGLNFDEELLRRFFESVPKEFRYWDIYLNRANLFPVPGFPLYQRTNYVLDLSRPYEELKSEYRENIRRNCRRSEQLGCKPVTDVDLEQVLSLAWQQIRSHTRVARENRDRFRKLFEILKSRGGAITYGMLSAASDLLASCVFFFSHGRAYYILVGNHPNGRTSGASHALIDAFIKDHAGRSLLLDFEGSDIRNLAFFYSSFGAREEKYPALRLNRLPGWLRWLKPSG